MERIARLNERHCAAQPIYGADLCHAVLINKSKRLRWSGALGHQLAVENVDCESLKDMVKTQIERLQDLNDIFERFVL